MKAIRYLLGKTKKGTSGQSALEYALVIAVVVVAIVGVAYKLFIDPDEGVSKKIFGKTVKNVENAIDQSAR
jgi:uncharacterized protein (UPF0333 family)